MPREPALRLVAPGMKLRVRTRPRSDHCAVVRRGAVGRARGVERLRQELVQLRACDVQVRRVRLAAQRGLSNQFFAHERLAQQIRDYDVDGIVFHGIKSCRFVSSGMADTRDYLNKRLKMPSLYIESDLIDPRYWSDAQIKNRVDAFFETLHQSGGAPRANKAVSSESGRAA